MEDRISTLDWHLRGPNIIFFDAHYRSQSNRGY
jgi:hypothetical protein